VLNDAQLTYHTHLMVNLSHTHLMVNDVGSTTAEATNRCQWIFQRTCY